MDPFATALAALHGAAGAVTAVYLSTDGDRRTIRVVKAAPTEIAAFADSRIAFDTARFVVRRADVERPARGDILIVGDESFTVNAEPELDVEGVSWTIAAPRS